jgi:hypothetical protein
LLTDGGRRTADGGGPTEIFFSSEITFLVGWSIHRLLVRDSESKGNLFIEHQLINRDKLQMIY